MTSEQQALEAAMERLRASVEAYNAGDAYGKTFVPGLSRAVEVVQRVMLERQEAAQDAEAERLTAEAALPRRRDQFEQWLKARRDRQGEAVTAMDELHEAKVELRAALLRGVKGTLAGDRADELIGRYQTALKVAHREKVIREAVPRLPLSVRVGSVWRWEPLKPHATETARITATRWNGEEWWIETEGSDGKRHWNELDRFVEACVLVEPGPQDVTP